MHADARSRLPGATRLRAQPASVGVRSEERRDTGSVRPPSRQRQIHGAQMHANACTSLAGLMNRQEINKRGRGAGPKCPAVLPPPPIPRGSPRAFAGGPCLRPAVAESRREGWAGSIHVAYLFEDGRRLGCSVCLGTVAADAEADLALDAPVFVFQGAVGARPGRRRGKSRGGQGRC